MQGKQEGIKNLKEAIIEANTQESATSFFDIRTLFKNIIEETNDLRKSENDYGSFPCTLYSRYEWGC